jgi:glutamate-ammonia-ligase adenylyltransferase
VFAKLRPLLLERLALSPDPDATLNQFVRFVETYGLRSLLFELLVTNPKLLELLVRTFDVSRFGGDLLVRRPQFLEEVTRDERLGRAVDRAEHLERLKTLTKTGDPFETVRAYRQRQILRILLRDVLGWTDLNTLFREQSELAEACLIFVNGLLGGNELTIIALGKFGGQEITYGADLDVLFVGSDGGLAQKLLGALAQPSAEGSLSKVDARLRPEGEKGPLVCSIESYAAYYNGRAQPWELQALTRARPVSGPQQEEFITVAKAAWNRAAENPDLARHIDSMLNRVRQERGSGSEFLDFKTGAGGIIEAEFLVQTLQMQRKIWQPNWNEAVTALRQAGALSEKDAGDLTRGYEFLRRCESVLRRFENTSVSTLPRDAAQQSLFSHRLGEKTIEAFREKYEAARTDIHRVYVQTIHRDRATRDEAGAGAPVKPPD